MDENFPGFVCMGILALCDLFLRTVVLISACDGFFCVCVPVIVSYLIKQLTWLMKLVLVFGFVMRRYEDYAALSSILLSIFAVSRLR